MNLKNKNSKRLTLLFLTGFVITGTIACNNKDDDTIDIKETINESIDTTGELEKEEIVLPEEETSQPTESIENTEDVISKEMIVEAKIVQTENIQNTEELEESPDEIINNYLELEKEKINQVINSEDINTIKETIASSFITLVDFIYYDEPIYGITYDELSEATKENVKDSFQLVDTIINECFPDYKENLSSKYNEIKEKGTSVIYEKLGEDNWNQLGDAKDNLKESISDVKEVVEDLTESGKTKVKNWYEEFKINHQ